MLSSSVRELSETVVEPVFDRFVSSQSIITFFDNKAIKQYAVESYNYRILGRMALDIDWEIQMQRLFTSKHSFHIERLSSNSYAMPRFFTSLGGRNYVDPQKLREILSLISVEDLYSQLDEIVKDLEHCNLTHYDVQPGNLLFSQSEKILKLSDFYWCNKHEIVKRAELFTAYGQDDKKAIEHIKNDISNILNGKEYLNVVDSYIIAGQELFLRNNYNLLKKDKKYLFRFYKKLGKDALLVDKVKSRRYLLRAFLMKPYDLSILSKLFRSFRKSLK